MVAGNFFEAVPPGADAYLVRHIIHDWDDDNPAQLSPGDGPGLLVVEGVVPPGNEPSVSNSSTRR